ncbi:hypothetical protein F4694_004089 [Bacillus niacini]|uniref:Uncharacterized protein n=1 Tax=Neobacillus niacini TaxID=86668 RepID=A0A852TJM3_9BACI|nr:hypothetical protein [Neobacillus niacini]NYE07304.1 hypothetical protein [Neobacillus niacini]
MRRVTVKHYFKNEIDHEWPNIGVFFEERGIVIQVDEYGLVELFEAKMMEGSDDVVLVKEGAEDLSSDNPEFVVNLIIGEAK